MKKDGKYRFTLQFPDDGESQRRAGDLLENLGNRKSIVVVDALNEYLDAHPELMQSRQRVRIHVQSDIGKAQIEQMIRSIVEEKLSAFNAESSVDPTIAAVDTAALVSDDDIEQMLGNLELF